MAITPPITLPTTWSDGQVLFASALNGNFTALLAAINSGRQVLTGPTTFYVSPSGSDNNTGINPNAPAAAVSNVIDVLMDGYDLNAQNVTIQLSNGTYSETV